MYLIDTSELRKSGKANRGVREFFRQVLAREVALFMSVVTVGELRRGVELIRYRGDLAQAQRLEAWLQSVIADYAECILDFVETESQIWGRLRVPHPENFIDKQIAAKALVKEWVIAV